MNIKFYRCKKCGNILSVVHDGGVVPACCGEPMTVITPNTKEEVSLEKHVPVIEVKGREVVVTVGSTLHPMLDVHWIEWILLVTDKGKQFKALKPGDAPVAHFALLADEKVVSAYAYCNLHDLWGKHL